jgi:hypothetical protein
MSVKKNLKLLRDNLLKSARDAFKIRDPKDLGKGLRAVEIDGYINPFIDVEVIYKGESLCHESLAMLVNTRLKDYNLLPEIQEGYSPEISLRLPTGGEMKFPMYIKSLDDKQFRQRGDGLPKADENKKA